MNKKNKKIEEQHRKLIKELLKPSKDILQEMTEEKMHLLHLCTGLTSEMGEALEEFNYACLGCHKRVRDEFGDMFFYFNGLLDFYKISLRDIYVQKVEHNILAKKNWTIHLRRELSKNVGLFSGVIKKFVFFNGEMDIDKVKMLFSKIYESMDACLITANSSSKEAIEQNIEKLKKRYPSGTYTDKSALEQGDKNI